MKRFISMVLSLVIILGMVPATAFLTVEASAAESVTYTYVQQKPVTIASSDTGTVGVWYNNGSTFDMTEGAANYIEIVEDGCMDAGAMHVYQDNVTNSDMSLGVFIGGQAAGTYTLKVSVKGDLGLSGQTCKFYPYGCFDLVENLHTALGTDEVSDWTEVTFENITAASNFYYLIFSFSKYNWATDMYIDNVQLINSSGVDVLAGVGSFYAQQEVTASSADTNQWPVTMDTAKVSESYSAYQGEWTPFCHYTADQGLWQGTWPAWDSTIADSNYGEIIADGYQDAGSLHLKSAGSRNTGVAIDAGMTSGETYTLGLWVKGSASSNKILGLYGNGDGTIIGNPTYCADAVLSSVPGSWTYLEKSFTADRSNLILVANDWGVADLYIDNIILTDGSGNDLLDGYGDFYYSTEGLLTLDTDSVASAYNAPNGQWSVMYPAGASDEKTWPAWDDTHYGEIVVSGNQDQGALHLVSAQSKNVGVAIGVDMVKEESYTLGLWAKGTSNSGKVLFSYANGDPTIIGASGELTADWSYYEITFTCSTTQLNLVASDWGNTDIYIDNITLKGSDGVDLLDGYGNFLQEEGETTDPETTLPEFTDPTEEGWIAAADYTPLQLGTDYDYSFAVLGDIQHITDYTPTDLHYLFDYILDNKDAKNIQFVFGMGDSTNDLHNEANNLVEWQLVQDQFFRFNGVLPYTVIRGNHDNVVRMNTYLADPEKSGYTDQLDGFYQEGNVVNVWKEFSVGGVDYLNIIINYESSDSVLQWAADVIEAHPNHRVIVGTHVYLLEDGSYDNEMNPSFGDSGIVNNAQQVWDKLISQHENIFMVLCGHNSTDDVLVQHKTGVNGNQITEIRVNSQYTDLVYMNKDGDHRGGSENGVGMVTLLYFKNDGTQVAAEHYSTLRGWYREMQTFEIEPYGHYGWRYDETVQDSYAVDVYAPVTGLADAPAILQSGLGEYTLQELVTENGRAYSGTGVSILPDYNMDLGTHTYALHSGTRTVDPSSTYTISYKIRGLGENTRMWPQIHFCRSALGGSDTWEPQYEEGRLISGPVSDWQEVSFDIYTDGTTSAIEIYFIANGGEVYIDDFSIVKKKTAADRNLLPNGDFETVTSGVPSGWYAASASVGSIAAAEGEGMDGSIGLQVTQTADGYTTAKLTGGDYALSLEAGAEYILTYSFKTEETGTKMVATIREKAASADAALGGYRQLTAVSGTAGQWVTHTESFTTSEDHAGCNIWLNAYGSMVIDNVSLVKVASDDTDDTDTTYGINIVTNGDFEQGTDGEYPTGFYTMKTGGIGTVEKVSGAGVDGSAAVRIEPRPGYILKNEETIAVAANTEYTLSYMVRIPGKTTDLTPVIRLYDTDGALTVLTGTAAKVSGTTEWKQVTYTFTTAADTAGIQICLLVYGGRVDVDNISLTADGSELMDNGSFSNGLEGFAGEFVQGLQEGTVISVSSARPNSLIVDAKTADGILNAYDADALIGTVDWLYGELEHKVNFGLRIADADTAAAVAAWITQRHVENLWVIADSTALLDTVLAANENVKAVLDCTADNTAAESCKYAYALVDTSADISALQTGGIGVIVVSDTVTEQLLKSGADAVLTADSLAAISSLENIPMAEDTAQVVQWNLSLGDQIGVNFYLQIAEEQASGAVVNITVNGETTAIAVSSLTAEDGLYHVRANVAAAQMTEDILLTVVADGILAENSTYTVRQYADYILDEANGYAAVTKALVKEMLSYGAAAQNYFDCNTDKPADAGLTGVGDAEVPADAGTKILLSGSISGVKYYGASLVFRTNTAVRLYFSGDVSGCRFTVAGETLTVTQKNGMHYVEVDGITPDQLDGAVTVTVTKGDEVLTVSYSPMNYIVRMYAKSASSDLLKTLLKAMYNYHLAAKSYKSSL